MVTKQAMAFLVGGGLCLGMLGSVWAEAKTDEVNLGEKMSQELGLTPEQTAELQSIQEKARAESESLKTQLKTKRKALMDYMKSPNADQDKARQMFAEITALQTRLGQERIETWFEMKQHLTAEQVQKMSEIHQERMEKFHHKRYATVVKGLQ